MTNHLIFIASLAIIIASVWVPSQKFVGKLLSVLAVILGATLIVTGFLRLIPGNPVDYILSEQATQAARQILSQSLGLTDIHGNPIGFVDQYSQFLTGLFTGGVKSFRTQESVITLIGGRLPYTLLLALASMGIALCLAIPLGIWAAFRRGTLQDLGIMTFAVLGVSIPRFWLGPMLLLLFAIQWHVLPVSGVDEGWTSLILPAFTLGSALAAILTRMLRASLLDVLSEDYIRQARAKGASEHRVFVHHALRNALIPVTTIAGLQFGALLAGAVVIEKVFNWPGIGLLLLESIQKLDIPVVQAVVLVIAFSYVLVNSLVDLLYTLWDPRLRVEGDAP